MVSYKTFSKSFCDKIIDYSLKTSILEEIETPNRKYKRAVIMENDFNWNWLWNSVDKMIKENLGDSYSLTDWIMILRYDVGDYFLEHIDLGNDSPYRDYSGGVELLDKSEYEGGEFVLEKKVKKIQRGELFTHLQNQQHSIKKITKGTRWALHFCIVKDRTINLF